MLKVEFNHLLNELMVFNMSDLTEEDIRGSLLSMVEEIVEAVNRPEDEGYIWDVISRYESILKGNANVESIINGIYTKILNYRKMNRFDDRLKMRVDDSHALKGRFFALIVMDLDATFNEYLTLTGKTDSPDIDDLVTENPSPEELDSIFKTTH